VRSEKSVYFRLHVHHKASTREKWDSAYATDGIAEKAWLLALKRTISILMILGRATYTP